MMVTGNYLRAAGATQSATHRSLPPQRALHVLIRLGAPIARGPIRLMTASARFGNTTLIARGSRTNILR
jgi:hypothetical protein